MKTIDIEGSSFEDWDRLHDFAHGCAVVKRRLTDEEISRRTEVFFIVDYEEGYDDEYDEDNEDLDPDWYNTRLRAVRASGAYNVTRTTYGTWTVIEPNDDISDDLRQVLIENGYTQYAVAKGVKLFNKLVAHTRSSDVGGIT